VKNLDNKILKICVSDIVGKVRKRIPRVILEFPFVEMIFSLIDIVFVGCNVLRRPPTTLDDLIYNLQAS